MALVGCPDRRIDRLCITCCSPSNLHFTPGVRRDLVYVASATGSLYRPLLAIMAQAVILIPEFDPKPHGQRLVSAPPAA